MERGELKRAIEGLLFSSEKPIGFEEINLAFERSLEPAEIRSAIGELKNEYESQRRGFRLCEIAGGYQLLTDPALAPILKRFYQAREKRKLSQASLETLSVVAYKQPVTRADIEFIRGVNVDGALGTLLEKGFVRIAGRKDVPGRPMLYTTTQGFLEHFGLKSLEELPALKEFSLKDLDPALLPPELKQQPSEEPS